MWWRAPWFEQRRALLGLALFDALVMMGTYNVLFKQRFGRWAGITGSIATLMLIWLTLSYLLGRYSRNGSKKRLWSIGWVSAVIVTITMASVWLGIASDPRALPIFVIPLVGWTAALSSLAGSFVINQACQSSHWLMVITPEESEIVKRELHEQVTIEPLSLQICHNPNQAITELAENSNCNGITIGEQVALGDELIQVLLQRRNLGQPVLDLLDWCEWKLQRVPPDLLSPRWLLLAEGFRLRPGQIGWRIKRLGDVSVAAILLVLACPILAVSALAIKLEDGGQITYSQIRTGLYNQNFRIWKMRTMREKSEQNGARWTSEDDPRITKVGHWLRRFRIDELPQLINVVSGDMSLIGPRPERPEFEKELEKIIPHYRVRHWIRPGLSGWSQVCYPYGASVNDSRIKLSYDLYYIRNFSPWLDALIFLKTIRLVARGEGAIPRSQ